MQELVGEVVHTKWTSNDETYVNLESL